MSIIDKTYFEAHNLVVNVNEPEPNSATDRDLDVLIASVEEYVLSNALGRKFYNEIKQYYKELPSEPIPAEVNNLVDGCEYTYNGEERYWRGLRQENTKESLLADLVYYCYHTNNVTLTTSFGEQAVEGKLGNRASIFRKVIKAWNSFVAKLSGASMVGVSGWTNEGNPYWIRSNRRGNGVWVDYYGVDNSDDVSLWQFLKENKSEYPLLKMNEAFFMHDFKNELGV